MEAGSGKPPAGCRREGNEGSWQLTCHCCTSFCKSEVTSGKAEHCFTITAQYCTKGSQSDTRDVQLIFWFTFYLHPAVTAFVFQIQADSKSFTHTTLDHSNTQKYVQVTPFLLNRLTSYLALANCKPSKTSQDMVQFILANIQRHENKDKMLRELPEELTNDPHFAAS